MKIINDNENQIRILNLIELGKDDEIEKVRETHKAAIETAEITEENKKNFDIDITARQPQKEDIGTFDITEPSKYRVVQVIVVKKENNQN